VEGRRLLKENKRESTAMASISLGAVRVADAGSILTLDSEIDSE
jgi:hypothetical protein